MLELYKKPLEEAGCFKQEYPATFLKAAEVIPGNIPLKMKILMTATELTVFASHLRKPILWHGANIPVNIISFLVGGSGAGKGLSVKSVAGLVEEGYQKINTYRTKHAKAQAVMAAEDDGKSPTAWRKYYSPPRDLKAAISTLPGTMKHLAALESGILGAGYMYVDEVGSELVSNADLSENIVALAVGYDSGEIPAKIVKDDANQVPAIHNLPYSALMFGSPANIIFDEKVKKKFKDEFSTKLSRRTSFSFVKEDPKRLHFSSNEESRAHARAERNKTQEAKKNWVPWFSHLVDTTTHKPLTVTEEVEDLFSDYQNYNEWLSDTYIKQYPMSILHRQHLQWKSLKIAGALAILENSEEVTAKHFVEAVRFSEMYAGDMLEFEKELEKEPYELFADYMQATATNGYLSISAHKLRKMGFVRGTGATPGKLLELIELARSYDNTNTYQYADGYIHFYEEAIAPVVEDMGELV